jgi:Spy/CpxP family protein refolding chaperone
MKLFTRTKFLGPIGLSVAGAIALVAVPSGAAPAVSDVTDEAAATDAPAKEEREGSKEVDHQKREPLGPVALIGGALAKVELTDEQRTELEKIGERISSQEQRVMEARRALQASLAEQFESGQIDERKLVGEIDALVKAREEASPRLRKALEDVHRLLDEKQRGAFVEAVQNRMRELSEASREWFDAFAKDLRLSDDQKKRMREVLDRSKPQLEKDRATVSDVFEAFKKPDFSMETVVPIGEVGKRTRERVERMVGVAKDIGPILTPEQRKELAERIEPKKDEEMKDEAKDVEKPAPSVKGEPIGEVGQSIVVGRTVRAGAVRGWGGGYARGVSVTRGYAAGYPLVGGYGPVVW